MGAKTSAYQSLIKNPSFGHSLNTGLCLVQAVTCSQESNCCTTFISLFSLLNNQEIPQGPRVKRAPHPQSDKWEGNPKVTVINEGHLLLLTMTKARELLSHSPVTI